MTINPMTPFPAPTLDSLADGTTGTGLDFAVRLVGQDFGLAWRLTGADIAAGAAAADGINQLIVQAIRATGAANDGEITTSDVYALSSHIRSTALPAFTALHGNDENNSETGYHLVQNDGAYTRLFGQNALDGILDSIYHIGFRIIDGRFVNEDGNANATVEDVAFWINSFLAADLTAGTLANDRVAPDFKGTTGTGLDALVDDITGDHGLNSRLSRAEINQGAQAADAMNRMIVDAIRATGVADDGDLTTQDMYDLNAWLRANRLDAFTVAHGDDENGSETGFHLVQGDGQSGYLFGERAIDTVGDGLYHLAFDIEWGRFVNEDGDANARLADVADWLTNLLRADIDSGALGSGRGATDPSRFAGDLVYSRMGTLTANGSTGFFDAGARQGFRLDKGTFALGFNANSPDNGDYQVLFSRDGASNQSGDLTVFLHQGHVGVYLQDGRGGGSWMVLRDVVVEAGRDYDLAITFGGPTGLSVFLNGERVATDHDFRLGIDGTGRGLVIGGGTWGRDGANPNVVSNVFDGRITDFRLYDRVLNGFEIRGLSDAAPLDAPQPGAPADTGALPAVHRGTGLTADVYDRSGNFASVQDLIAQVATQANPNLSFDADRIDFGAQSMETTLAQFIGDAGSISGGGGNTQMSTIGLHLTGFIWLEPGTHLITVQSDDGFLLRLGGETISSFEGTRGFEGTSQQVTVTGGLYAIEMYYFDNGYDQGLRLMIDGETAGPERFWRSVADFQAALGANGPMPDGGIGPDPDAPQGTTGSGLDQIIDIIMADEGLANEVSGADRAEAVAAANLINGLILDGIETIGAARDGVLTAAEVSNLAAWIRANHYAVFLAAHGNDEAGVETGYHLIQNDGATTRLWGENAVNTIFDSIYHIGFEIEGDRFVNEDGDANARVEDVAWWLSAFLAEELGNDGAGTGGNSGPTVGAKGSASAPDVVSVGAPVTTLASGALTLTLGADAFHGFGNGLGNRMLGNGLDNVVDGRGGNDTLAGGNGNDTLVGGSGADRMEGGRGDDTYEVDNAGDVAVEAPGGGIDTVLLVDGPATWRLGADFENLTVHGHAIGRAEGNGAANRIDTDRGDNLLVGAGGNDALSAGEGTDTLDGGSGNDTLDGGAGSDRMAGGDGNDTYVVDNRRDNVVETATGGTDTVESSVDHTLGDTVENLVLTGMRGLTGRGNDGANSITGTSQNDRIDGRGGADRMAGGHGNDSYTVDNAGDIVREEAGQGRDEVRSSVTFTLGANIEIGRLTGTGNIGLTGNAGDNDLGGNDGANVLNGMGGADVLRGGAGNDTLVGGNGRDTLLGGTGADRFVFDDGHSAPGAADSIRDFLRAEGDRIDLSLVDAVAGGTDDGFRVVAALTGSAGQLVITAVSGGWQVLGDVTGDGVADFVLSVQSAGPFGAADLVL
jgi:Ca2+-binding RTX toxin-like protein